MRSIHDSGGVLADALPAPLSPTEPTRRRRYIRVPVKLALMSGFALCWLSLSLYVAIPWIDDLAITVGPVAAWVIVSGIALIPGYANAFLIAGLVFDWRPTFKAIEHLPGLSVLIAAYNEEDCIEETLASLYRQQYHGPLEIIVIDDGSKDSTAAKARAFMNSDVARSRPYRLRLLVQARNGGKALALNTGLAAASHQLIATLDADSLLYGDALNNIVSNHLQSPPNTAATAGTVLVRNSRKNLITRLQEWDYFMGIAVVKRVQSLLQGTLVAQGAFSMYDRKVLEDIGGWRDMVGEDIVLTWAIMEQGYRVGYAENAFAFTNVPENYGAYYRQRKRWSRGMIEAFKQSPGVLVHPRLNTPFVWLNLLFPYLDAMYFFVFLPGILAAAFFQYYVIAGLMTILLLPLAILLNAIMFYKQRAVFRQYGLRVRRNVLGAIVFVVGYQLLLAPACLMGYFAELGNLRKSW